MGDLVELYKLDPPTTSQIDFDLYSKLRRKHLNQIGRVTSVKDHLVYVKFDDKYHAKVCLEEHLRLVFSV